ncbi:PH domain-containing protein [Candidatus Omnitrophota bacterium]
MPLDVNIVAEQIKQLGDFHEYFTKKEIAYLPSILNEGEKIHAMTSGLYEGNTWLIVVTNNRLVFLDKGMIYGLKQVELPLYQISGIAHKTGIAFGKIEISTSAGSKTIDMILKQYVVKVTQTISDLARQASAKPATQAPQTDVASQIEKLVELKEKGILTEEEFQSQKKKLLA